MRELLAETRGTLNAGSEMATSIQDAIESLDMFVRYVVPRGTNATVVGTNRRPFDVVDYGQAASQVGDMAKEMNALLTSLNQSAPQVTQLSKQATADARHLLHSAFWLGALLILILLAGSVLAALTYRALANKLRPASPPQPT